VGYRSLRQNAEALANILETRFQPLTVPSVPTFIEMVAVALRSYFMTPASEPNLTRPEEVHAAIRVLKFIQAPGLNCLSNRAFKHLSQRAVSLFQFFNAALLTNHFSTA
jgi:hypothetical protein